MCKSLLKNIKERELKNCLLRLRKTKQKLRKSWEKILHQGNE